MIRARIVPVALVAVAVAALVLLISAVFGGSSDKYRVRALFKDSNGLRKNSDVKIGGVPGGKIKSIDLTKNDLSLVTMELDKGLTVGEGARAEARPVNLLGEKYVDLEPGNLKRPVASGSTTIPTSRTGTAVEIDDVLNMLEPNARAGLRILINEAGLGMAGRGADFNSMLDELPPALDQSRRVVGEFAAQNARLRDLINEGDRVLAAIGPHDKDLQNLVTQADRALTATSNRRAELGATVQRAPGALGQLRRTLGELRTTAVALVPASRGLRQAAGPLADTLTNLPAFAHDARGTLATAQRVAPKLSRLGSQGAPVVRRLRPTAEQLAAFTKNLAPLTATFDEGKAFHGLLGLMAGWRRTIQTSDGLGHVFRLRTILDRDFFASAAGRMGLLAGTPARQKASAPKHQIAGVPAVKLPEVRKPVGEAVRKATDAIKGVLGGATGKLTDATRGLLGGAQGQQPPPAPHSDTSQLLDYLLGP